MGDRAHDAARRMHARALELLPAMHAQVSPTAPPDVHPASMVSTLTAAIVHAVAEEAERVAMGLTPEQAAGVRIISSLVESLDGGDEDDTVDGDLMRLDLVRLWDAFAPGTRALDEHEMDPDHDKDGRWFTDYTCADCGVRTRFYTQSDNHCPTCREEEKERVDGL